MIDDGRINEMATAAAEKIAYWKWDSFSISTIMPKKWLIDEDREWDAMLDGKSESAKSRMNHEIARLVEKKTGKSYFPINADGRVTFNLENGKVDAESEPLFVFGRYHKLEAGLSQSRWICKKCEGDGCFKCDWKGRYYVSVEEIIGDAFKAAAGAKDYVLHASGREDVDVINTAGRPFVLEIKSPKHRKFSLDEVSDAIRKGKQVEALTLRFVKPGFVETVTESHFEKEYEADVEFSEPLDEAKLKRIMGFAGVTIEQRTPKRVAHRRADLIRKRKIVEMILIRHEGSTATFRIMAEAGTYIKELVSGDGGRTAQSFASAAGCEAKCTSLKVVRIYDEFLDFVMGRESNK